MYKAIFIGISAVLISGCQTLAKNYLPDDVFHQTSTPQYKYVTDSSTIDVSLLGDMKDYEGSENKSKRNEVISKAISLSDQKCTLHKAGILSNANTWNVGASSLSILLSGAAAVLNHAQTASELAASAAATTGIQATVNKEIYADALATTILRAIDSIRTQKKAVLETGMGENHYTLSQAIIDIQAYHDSCSMMAGLVEVTRAIDNRKPSRNELERDIQILEQKIKNLNESISVSPEKKKQTSEELLERWKQKVEYLSNSTSAN